MLTSDAGVIPPINEGHRAARLVESDHVHINLMTLVGLSFRLDDPRSGMREDILADGEGGRGLVFPTTAAIITYWVSLM